MATVTAAGTVELPVDTTFERASDYHRMPEWVFGLHTIEPVNGQSQGVGAEFRGTGKIGPIALTGTSRVTEWEPCQHVTIALVTHNGIEASVTILTTPVGPATTRIGLTVDYRFPGGLAGRALRLGIEPLLGTGIRYTERSLRRECLRTG